MRRSCLPTGLVVVFAVVVGATALAFSGATSSWDSNLTDDNDYHGVWTFAPLISESDAGTLAATWANPPAGEQSAAITVNGSVRLRSDTSPYPTESGTVTFALSWHDCANAAHLGVLHIVWVNAASPAQVAFTEVIRDWCPYSATSPDVVVKWQAPSGRMGETGPYNAFNITWVSN